MKEFNWREVLSANLEIVMARQFACAEFVVKDRNWDLNLGRGVISFGNDEYPVQFLGGESDSTGTWLWGWENVNNFPEHVVVLANKIKEIGEELNAEPLTTAEIDLDDDFNGHNFSTVSVALSNEKVCYYSCPHGGGAVFVVFSDVPEEVFAPVDLHTFIKVTMQCIQGFDVDHKVFVEGFLTQNGTKFEWQESAIIAKFESNLRIDFNEKFLITGVKSL